MKKRMILALLCANFTLSGCSATAGLVALSAGAIHHLIDKDEPCQQYCDEESSQRNGQTHDHLHE